MSATRSPTTPTTPRTVSIQDKPIAASPRPSPAVDLADRGGTQAKMSEYFKSERRVQLFRTQLLAQRQEIVKAMRKWRAIVKLEKLRERQRVDAFKRSLETYQQMVAELEYQRRSLLVEGFGADSAVLDATSTSVGGDLDHDDDEDSAELDTPDAQHIRTWLERQGLPQYADAFIRNEIGADGLLNLGEADLVQLGVTKMGHRKQIMRAIEIFRDAMQQAENDDDDDELTDDEDDGAATAAAAT